MKQLLELLYMGVRLGVVFLVANGRLVDLHHSLLSLLTLV
jgi:hypothetical protein